MRLPDRDVLETIIIPHLDKGNTGFVGIDKHTQYYPKLFCNSNVLVIDQDNKNLDPSINFEQVKLQELHLIRSNYFDLLIANGLASFGTDSRLEIEEAFNGAYHSMSPNGIFVWGWSDSNHLRTIDPVFITHKFKKYIFEPLGTWRYSALQSYDKNKKYDWDWEKIRKQNHTFDFYIKVIK